MIHRIENDALALEVSTAGAELHALYSRGGPERGWLWGGDPAVWNRRAPLCFPWCGRLKDGYFEEAGILYHAPIHGLVRDLEHAFLHATPTELVFSAVSSHETLARWPWPFRFETHHRLDGDAVVTTCTAVNTGDRPMPVQIGFHTALRCPFTPDRTPGDYLLRFERQEYPNEIICGADGLVTGVQRPVFSGQSEILIDAHLFDSDSICLSALESAWIQLEERGTGRALRLDISGYPYVLLWSMPGLPGFLCIEPWSGLPSRRDGGHTLWERPGTITLAPGESCTRLQRLTVGAS